jgi:hypothetical protein
MPFDSVSDVVISRTNVQVCSVHSERPLNVPQIAVVY